MTMSKPNTATVIGLVLGLMVSGGVHPASAQIGTWVPKLKVPTARSYLFRGEAAVATGVYAIGGYNGSVLNTVEFYTPATNTWASEAPLPTATMDGAVQVVSGEVYAIGGTTTAAGGAVATVLQYDPMSNTWTPKSPMPTARRSLASAVVNNKIYAISGVDATDTVTAVVEMYDPGADTWTPKASIPVPRQYLTAEAVNGKIYTFGGNSSQTFVDEYDPTTDTWTPKASMPLVINVANSATVSNKIYVLGGNFSTTVLEYDPASDMWLGPLASMPTQRELAATGAVNGKLYVIGGGFGSSANEEFTPPASTPPLDSDFDGVPDTTDNCQFVSNSNQKDTDADGVGDACDNCPNDFNPAQSDGNQNGIGDVCDTGTPTPLTLTQVRLKASKPSRGNGTILVRGNLDPSEYGTLADALANDFIIAITGVGLTKPEKMSFPGVRCFILGKVTECVGNGGEVVTFRPQASGNLLTVKITAQNRSFVPPLSGQPPAAVTLTLGNLDRRAQSGSCTVPASGKSANCH
jgi:hypothetical protein